MTMEWGHCSAGAFAGASARRRLCDASQCGYLLTVEVPVDRLMIVFGDIASQLRDLSLCGNRGWPSIEKRLFKWILREKSSCNGDRFNFR
jgi:hypothetical protein